MSETVESAEVHEVVTPVIIQGVGAGIGRLILRQAIERADIRVDQIFLTERDLYTLQDVEYTLKHDSVYPRMEAEIATGEDWRTGVERRDDVGWLSAGRDTPSADMMKVTRLTKDQPIPLVHRIMPLITTSLRPIDTPKMLEVLTVTTDANSQRGEYASQDWRQLLQGSPLADERALVYRHRFVPQPVVEIGAAVATALKKSFDVRTVSVVDITNPDETNALTDKIGEGRPLEASLNSTLSILPVLDELSAQLIKRAHPNLGVEVSRYSVPLFAGSLAVVSVDVAGLTPSPRDVARILEHSTRLTVDEHVFASSDVIQNPSLGSVNPDKIEVAGAQVTIPVWYDRDWSRASRVLDAAIKMYHLALAAS